MGTYYVSGKRKILDGRTDMGHFQSANHQKKVIQYIRDQKHHHRKDRFTRNLSIFLNKYSIRNETRNIYGKINFFPPFGAKFVLFFLLSGLHPLLYAGSPSGLGKV